MSDLFTNSKFCTVAYSALILNARQYLLWLILFKSFKKGFFDQKWVQTWKFSYGMIPLLKTTFIKHDALSQIIADTPSLLYLVRANISNEPSYRTYHFMNFTDMWFFFSIFTAFGSYSCKINSKDGGNVFDELVSSHFMRLFCF